MRNNAWIPTLFAAEEIPEAMVTFVSLLMFLQVGFAPAQATAWCGLLFLPWVLKSFMRKRIRSMGHFQYQIIGAETAIFCCTTAMAVVFSRGRWIAWGLPTLLFLLSLLTAWHELAARMYYERMLYPRMQRFYTGPRIFFSQATMVITYGLLIIAVGGLQILYRHIAQAWSTGCYMTAGVMLLFVCYHMLVLRRPAIGNRYQHTPMLGAVKAELHIIDRIRHKSHWAAAVLTLGLLLLPQSLMFYSRVLFLLAKKDQGGLACTIQEVGFAHGTVGVLAFCIGMAMGRRLLHWIPARRIYWWMAIPLGLSPCVYLMMTHEPPTSLSILCIATAQAQLLFGFGLNICMAFVHYLSDERYRNATHCLNIPLVATVMLVPMALSGWLTQIMGFQHFFLMNALSAIPGWIALMIYHKHFFSRHE